MAPHHIPLMRAYLQKAGARTIEGDEAYTLCPLCRHPNQKLHINLTQGLWHCFHCQAEIPASAFQMDPGTRVLEPGSPQEPRSPSKVSLSLPWVEEAHQTLFSKEGQEGLQYLLSRGLSPAVIKYFKLGFIPGAIVVPNLGKNKVYSITLRYLDPLAHPKYQAFGPRFLFNSRYLARKTKSCVIFEGELDCISSIQLFPNLPAFA